MDICNRKLRPLYPRAIGPKSHRISVKAVLNIMAKCPTMKRGLAACILSLETDSHHNGNHVPANSLSNMLHYVELRVPTLPIAISLFPDGERTHGANQALLSQLLRLDEAVLKCDRMEGCRRIGPDMEPEGKKFGDRRSGKAWHCNGPKRQIIIIIIIIIIIT
jgi:hypothetical protein